MAKITKRWKAIGEKVQVGKQYPVDDAIKLLKSIPPAKFVRS